MDIIKWEDPPVHANTKTVWSDVSEALKANPGKWGKVKVGVNPGTGHHLRMRGCEVMTRNTRKNEAGKTICDVYARWPEATS